MTGYSAMFHADTAIDYDDAYSWYEEQQAGLGDRFLDAVRTMVQKIIINPEMFSIKYKSGYHEALVDGFPYTIVYRIYKNEKVVFISSIHHQRKHPRGKYRQ